MIDDMNESDIVELNNANIKYNIFKIKKSFFEWKKMNIRMHLMEIILYGFEMNTWLIFAISICFSSVFALINFIFRFSFPSSSNETSLRIHCWYLITKRVLNSSTFCFSEFISTQKIFKWNKFQLLLRFIRILSKTMKIMHYFHAKMIFLVQILDA